MRDYKRKPRRAPILPPGTWILALVILVIMLAGACTPVATHNAAGGYVDACGPELPGMIGDDC